MVGPNMEGIIRRQRQNRQAMQGSDQHGEEGPQMYAPNRGDFSSAGGSKNKEK